eukprot:1472101-Prymnesium_polylepis.1
MKQIGLLRAQKKVESNHAPRLAHCCGSLSLTTAGARRDGNGPVRGGQHGGQRVVRPGGLARLLIRREQAARSAPALGERGPPPTGRCYGDPQYRETPEI